MQYSQILKIITHPMGNDCDNQFFTANTKFPRTINPVIIYNHGISNLGIKSIGKLLNFYFDDELGGVSIIGLYDTEILPNLLDAHKKGRLFASSGAKNPKITLAGEILEWRDFEITLIDVTEKSNMIPCNFRARSLELMPRIINTKGLVAKVQENILNPTDGIVVKCGCGAAISTELMEEIGDAVEEVVANNFDEFVTESPDDPADPAVTANKGNEGEVKDKPEDDEIAKLFKTATDQVVVKSAQKDADIEGLCDKLIEAGSFSTETIQPHKSVLVSLKAAGNKEAIASYIGFLQSTSLKGVQKVERNVVPAKPAVENKEEADMEKLRKIAEEISGEVISNFKL